MPQIRIVESSANREEDAMLILVSAMLIAGGPVPPTIGEIFYGHAMGNNDPIPDLTPRPPKVPQCRTEDEIRVALVARQKGEEPSCILPRATPAATPR